MSNLSELLPSGGGQNLVEFVASGTLPSGKPVILNSNGTVTSVGLVSQSVSQAIPTGSETQFATGEGANTVIAFDPTTTGRFLIAFSDFSNNAYGSVILGTMSGTTLTFSTKVVFYSAYGAAMSVAFDPNRSGQFVVGYTGPSGRCYSILGEVSGSSITFGTGVIANSTGGTTIVKVEFNPNVQDQFLIAYRDTSNTEARVGTVSGTSISYGTAADIVSLSSNSLGISFDPFTANRFLVVVCDTSNSKKPYIRLGNISGTSITFATSYEVYSNYSDYISVAFDANTENSFITTFENMTGSLYGYSKAGTVASDNTITLGTLTAYHSGSTSGTIMAGNPSMVGSFVVIYKDATNAGKGTYRVGTVSGTNVSYGSAIVHGSGWNYNEASIEFDPNQGGKFVHSYVSAGNNKARIGQVGGTIFVTNLTSANLIGITSEATSSGGTAKINTWGGINEAQTSLTIASDYYAQTNGTITTATAGQKLGTAISATTINIRDLP
mgnify:CR=1 FL=1|tara:strand:- start:2634 stop:4121 length:1488 start_codon:yes stop_codon:yes gene_type:complete